MCVYVCVLFVLCCVDSGSFHCFWDFGGSTIYRRRCVFSLTYSMIYPVEKEKKTWGVPDSFLPLMTALAVRKKAEQN